MRRSEANWWWVMIIQNCLTLGWHHRPDAINLPLREIYHYHKSAITRNLSQRANDTQPAKRNRKCRAMQQWRRNAARKGLRFWRNAKKCYKLRKIFLVVFELSFIFAEWTLRRFSVQWLENELLIRRVGRGSWIAIIRSDFGNDILWKKRYWRLVSDYLKTSQLSILSGNHATMMLMGV